jgi:hypothetical protein
LDNVTANSLIRAIRCTRFEQFAVLGLSHSLYHVTANSLIRVIRCTQFSQSFNFGFHIIRRLFIMTTKEITLIVAVMLAVFIIILAVKDHRSFKSGQHIDYKGMIVSLGVLGTFSGIILGLWDFDSQQIFESVPKLLDGLKLAFFTSIFAMGLSVLLSVLQAQPEKKLETDTLLLDIKQQMEKANQALVAKLETTNRILAAVSEDVKQFRASYQRYQQPHRFVKRGANGQVLSEEATEWAAVQDNETGLIWEAKTNDGKLQDSQHTFTWYDPEAEVVGKENGGKCQGCRCDTAAYVKRINEMKLAGASDWRVPTIAELETLLKDKSAIDQGYFPYIQPDWYCSATPYSAKEGLWCFYVEAGQRGLSPFGYGHLVLTRSI